MKDSYCQARLIEKNLIRAVIFTGEPLEGVFASLLVDQKKIYPLKAGRRHSSNGILMCDFALEKDLELGHSYQLHIQHLGNIPLDVSEATSFPDFEEKYYYDGPLGARYSKQKTLFSLWAPLASSVILKYRFAPKQEWAFIEMERGDKGVYHGEIKGDHPVIYYLYEVVNSEVYTEVADPYAKSSTANGECSVSLDFASILSPYDEQALPRMPSPTSCVIYEGHVRDLTIDHHTDIAHKGKFLGLSEPNRKTDGGHPAGLDYLTYLGITHLQLLPIYDYQTVDERHPELSYNWGYDSAQYFVPEGSYSTDPDDPIARVKELSVMIRALESRGIRVVMDVVFNHVYEARDSIFEKVVPNYYFRRWHKGKMTNCSGCGNDLASERKMVSKLILDCCKWWIDAYHIRGFRFDLMGIIDVATLNAIKDYAKKVDPTFLLYGEGWNMGSDIGGAPLGTMANYAHLPDYGFFNDVFRENVKAYCAGSEDRQQAAKAVYTSSSLDFIMPRRFLDARQSINYVECHDNETYFDYLSAYDPNMPLENKLDRSKLALSMVLLSYGVPFIHAGQEIALSKWGSHNSYNQGDHYNKFSYKVLDDRFEMAEFAKGLISLRRKTSFLHVYDPRLIDQLIDVVDFGKCIHVIYLDHNTIAPLKEAEVFLNPTDSPYSYNHPTPMSARLGKDGVKEAGKEEAIGKIEARSAAIFVKK
ncbi:MAG: type I pullulanase [Bacillota bacterium]|nr:type I pullulanase [Bacillota bacterium]